MDEGGEVVRTIKMTESDYAWGAENSVGYCLACGEEHDCCEPDAAKYTCPHCNRDEVYGLELLMIMGLVEFRED